MTTMCDSKREDLKLWVEDFLKQRRYSKYELELSGNTSKGDGYLGEVTFVNVLTGIGREEEKVYNLVIKSAKKSEELRNKTPIKEVYEREIYIYSKVFPAFASFQNDLAVEQPFSKFAKCYSVFNENQREAIILQNLKYLQYDIHDRKKPQNLQHALMVFANYGKFHALSLAMKKQKPNFYKQLTANMDDLLSKFLAQANMLEAMTNTFREALEFVKKEDEATYRKLDGFNQEVVTKCLCKKREPEDGLSVILHGDCWNNNMMFTYRTKSKCKPSDMMFLDFQLSTIGSPIYDLSYYLYSIADEHLLKYHDLLLQAYHYSLTSFLEEELKESSYNYSLEDIKRHWKQYGSFGAIMAPFIVRIELSETNEVVDIAERAEAGEIGNAFEVKIKNKEDYEKRISAVLKHYASFL